MVRHNNMIPHNHFHKDWARQIHLHFDQPFRKRKRQAVRERKARENLPKPVDKLRPVVHCPTFRHHSKIRYGRGFSLDELKAAGINKRYAQTIGIPVDHRRRNKSQESILTNKEILKTYMSKLYVFPTGGKEVHLKKFVEKLNGPLEVKRVVKAREVTDEEANFEAFTTLQQARKEEKKRKKRKKKAARRPEEK